MVFDSPSFTTPPTLSTLKTETKRSAPELAVEQSQKKNTLAGKEKKRKLACWSAKMLEWEATMHEYYDTEDMMQRIIISQEGINELWTKLFGTIEKDVMEN